MDLTNNLIRVVVVVLSVVIVLFMLTVRPQLYPLWTVAMMAAVGLIALASLVNQIRASRDRAEY